MRRAQSIGSAAQRGALGRTLHRGAAATLVALLCAVTPAARADYKVLYQFPSESGVQVPDAVIEGNDGKLYGVLDRSIYRVDSCGTYETFVDMAQSPFFANRAVQKALLKGRDGSFYGRRSGDSTTPEVERYGSLFRLTPQGVPASFHVFDDSDSGRSVALPFVQTNDGTFYGSAEYFFSIPANGTALTRLQQFPQPGLTTGFSPGGRLVADEAGNFYGATTNGGPNGSGTIYKITAAGEVTVLAAAGKPESDNWYAHVLARGNDGTLYGSMQHNDVGDFASSVFALSPSGELETLHQFTQANGTLWTGQNDVSVDFGLLLARDGNLYGITTDGGLYRRGSIFRLGLDGVYQTLYSFRFEGSLPASIIEARDGTFYGVMGGPTGYRALFAYARPGTRLPCSTAGTSDDAGVAADAGGASDGGAAVDVDGGLGLDVGRDGGPSSDADSGRGPNLDLDGALSREVDSGQGGSSADAAVADAASVPDRGSDEGCSVSATTSHSHWQGLIDLMLALGLAVYRRARRSTRRGASAIR